MSPAGHIPARTLAPGPELQWPTDPVGSWLWAGRYGLPMLLPGLACHTVGEQGRSHVEGKMLVAVLVVGGFIGVLLVLYAAERIVKARAQARRRRSMSQRLAAATARAEEQHQQRQAAERASQELTSVLPAIKRPPLTVPGMGPHDTPRRKTGRECPRQHQGRPALPGRRSSGAGEHTVRRGSGAQP
jgi:hypothetical protein